MPLPRARSHLPKTGCTSSRWRRSCRTIMSRGMKNVRRATQGLGVIPIIGLIAHLLVLCFCTGSCHEGACPPLAAPAVHTATVATESEPSCCAHETPTPESHIECCECPGPPPELSALVSAPGWDLPQAAPIEARLELPPVRLGGQGESRPEPKCARAPPGWFKTHGARAPPFPLV